MNITLVQKYRGGRSRMVVRIGGKAGTARARQGRFCDAAGGGPDPDRRAGGDGRGMAERSAVNAPDRRDISHPRPGRSFGRVGGNHASHRAGAVA